MTDRARIVEKAGAYLAAGKVEIVTGGPGGIDCLVQGSYGVYAVSYAGAAGWACTCPARTAVCSHIIAAALVSGERGRHVVANLDTPQQGRTPDAKGRIRGSEIRPGDTVQLPGGRRVDVTAVEPSGRARRIHAPGLEPGGWTYVGVNELVYLLGEDTASG